MVRNGVGACEDRGGLAVFAVRIGEKERFGSRECLVQPAAFAHETALDNRAVVDVGPLRRDEIVGFDIHADVCAVAHRAVLEQRGPVDDGVVADADFADEFRTDDAALRADASHLRGVGFGIGVDHCLQRRHGFRAVAVYGHQVGRLGCQAVEYLYRAAAALVHRRHAHAVAERTPAAAFECRDAFDERSLADAVIADARADDARSGADFDRAFQVALHQLGRGEIVRNPHLRPSFRRRAEGFDSGCLRRCHVSVLGHHFRIKQMQI